MDKVIGILKKLPHVREDYQSAEFSNAPNGYPYYTKLAKILKPRCILEIGALQGWSIISMLHGHPHTADVFWVDNEQYMKDSNEMCKKNILHYYKTVRQGIPSPRLNYAKHVRDIPSNKIFDIIHIDGEHSEKAKLSDLNLSLSLNPRYILVDDSNNPSLPQVRKVVENWSESVNIPFLYIPTFRGMAAFCLEYELFRREMQRIHEKET